MLSFIRFSKIFSYLFKFPFPLFLLSFLPVSIHSFPHSWFLASFLQISSLIQSHFVFIFLSFIFLWIFRNQVNSLASFLFSFFTFLWRLAWGNGNDCEFTSHRILHNYRCLPNLHKICHPLLFYSFLTDRPCFSVFKI